MGKVQVICHAAAFLSGNLGTLKKLQKLKEQNRQQEKYAILNPLVDSLCEKGQKWTGIHPQIEGLEKIPDQTVVFVANHQSGILDALMMLCLVRGHRPCGFLMKESLEKIPLVSSWAQMIDCVFVDRENPREAVKALHTASEQLEQGISMVIFPEGTRTKNYPVLGEFKNGAFKIAQKNKVPLVPVVIYDSGVRMEANDGKLTPGTVHMKVLDPVYTDSMDRKEYKNLAETIHDRIEQEMIAYYGNIYTQKQNP